MGPFSPLSKGSFVNNESGEKNIFMDESDQKIIKGKGHITEESANEKLFAPAILNTRND
jgi:hypothetical protein